jgi:hypothetical protein
MTSRSLRLPSTIGDGIDHYYSYTLDPADEVEALLTECAGPRPELGL